jgi:hypothetical protein
VGPEFVGLYCLLDSRRGEVRIGPNYGAVAFFFRPVALERVSC